MANYGKRHYFLLIASVFALFLLKLLTNAGAATKPVYAVCSNCHTMHASQDSVLIREGSAPEVGVVGNCIECHGRYRWMLLKMDCIGCHAKDVSGGSSIITFGAPGYRVPQVAHSGTDLAGGNFRHAFGVGNESKGHNVHGFGINLSYGDLFNLPPGYDASRDPSSLKYNQFSDVAQVMCAGANGCHGNRDQLSHIEAMRGSHHTNDAILQLGGGFTETGQGATPGLSYRFLYGVHGGEDSDWEATKGPADHNEYKGAAGPTASSTYANTDTISEFCGECHGSFHGGSSSPWFRHPTDIPLPNSGEYTNYAAYNNTIPLARQSIPNGSSASSTITRGTDAVMCLSCHRAHASPYAKILRWDYKNTTLSTALSGCATCHSSLN
ncbi:MAG: cytochrome c3 family protein [Nitrospirota bacterium]|nr:cytochrome c3 family protein [Nitrospirota bacterium]